MYKVKLVGPGLPLPLPSTEASEMLQRTPSLCKSQIPCRPSPPAPLFCLLTVSHPSKSKPLKAPVASGSLLPELLPTLPTPGEPSLAMLTALPAPWAAWVLGLCHFFLLNSVNSERWLQCPLCAWSFQIQEVQRSVQLSQQNLVQSRAGLAGPGLPCLAQDCACREALPVPWAGGAGGSEPFPRPGLAWPPYIAVSRLGLCSLP